MNIKSIFMILITIYLFSSLVDASNMSFIGKDQYFKEVSLSFSDEPTLNVPVVLTLTIKAFSNTGTWYSSNSSFEISLPDGFELIDGDLSWTGYIGDGEVLQHNITVKIIEEGKWTIVAHAGPFKNKKYDVTGIAVSISHENKESIKIMSESLDEMERMMLSLKTESIEIATTKTVENMFETLQSETVDITGNYNYMDFNGKDRPIKNAKVELWHGGSIFPIKTSYTNDEGHFNFDNINNNDGFGGKLDIFVRIFSDYWKEPGYCGYVYDGNIYSITYWAQTSTYYDIPNGNVYIGNWTVTSENRGCWAIYDNAIDEYDFLKNNFGWKQPKIPIIWPAEKTRFFGHTWWGVIPIIYLIEIGEWRAWEPDAIQHEYGHAVMFKTYGDTSPPITINTTQAQNHWLSMESDHGFALIEGWAEFIPGVIQNSADYDSFNMETDEFENWGDSGDMDGDIIEGAVAALLWDIADSPNSKDDGSPGQDDDRINGRFDRVWNIISENNPNDINEFWDAWFARGYGNWAEMAAIYEDHGIDKCPDSDGDGYDNSLCGGTDCHDGDANIHPGVQEICDGKDNDCDGQTDEGFDNDGDGYATCSGDCNDNDPSIHPGAQEVCDGKDNDCDGQTDEGCTCQNGDTRPCGSDVGECQKGTQTCSSGTWGPCLGGVEPVPEVCPHNGKDDDCDGDTDEIFCGKNYCYDWSTHPPSGIRYYIETIAMGHYCANDWRKHDIDNDGYNERYLLIGEIFRTWFYCLAQEPTGYRVFDILNKDSTLSYGCTYSGGTASSVSQGYCDSPSEYSYYDQTFTSPQSRISSPPMYCKVYPYEEPGYGYDSYELNWIHGGGHREYAMYLKCGVDGDCPIDEYCYKPTLSDPTTYYCRSKCGNGVCDPGEVCHQDSQGPETCNGVDDNCNGVIDDGLAITCSSDSECPSDGCYSGTYKDYTCQNPGTCSSQCTYTTQVTDFDGDGYDTECDSDCNDSDNKVYPGAPEICDEKDNDCNGQTDENCPIICSSSGDCGTDGPVGDSYCDDNDVYRIYRTYTCNYPGRTISYCIHDDTAQLMEECGETAYDPWSQYYCEGRNVTRNRTAYPRGCSMGSCDDNETTEIEEAQCTYVCRDGSCTILEGDVNGDCEVNIMDLAAVGLCYGQPAEGDCESADLNQDGIVNIFDLAAVGLNYGRVC